MYIYTVYIYTRYMHIYICYLYIYIYICYMNIYIYIYTLSDSCSQKFRRCVCVCVCVCVFVCIFVWVSISGNRNFAVQKQTNYHRTAVKPFHF